MQDRPLMPDGKSEGFPFMGDSGEHRGMLKTTFVDANGGSWLAGPIFLPSIPERGEPVSIKEKAHHGRAT